MDNKGVEFAINAVPVHTKNWKWTVGMNYTWNDSEITKLNVIDSDANFVQTGAFRYGQDVQVFMVGQRPYTFYLAKRPMTMMANLWKGSMCSRWFHLCHGNQICYGQKRIAYFLSGIQYPAYL